MQSSCRCYSSSAHMYETCTSVSYRRRQDWQFAVSCGTLHTGMRYPTTTTACLCASMSVLSSLELGFASGEITHGTGSSSEGACVLLPGGSRTWGPGTRRESRIRRSGRRRRRWLHGPNKTSGTKHTWCLEFFFIFR